MNEYTGGPAFPVADVSKTQCPGMTLRDFFAAQVLPVVLNDYNTYSRHYRSDSQLFSNWREIRAKEAYDMADAFLKVRTL